MKTYYKQLACLLTIVYMASCTDKYTEELTLNSPVYVSYESFRSSVKQTATRQIEHPGKIYFKGNYLLVIEKTAGIHIVDVSNPSDPQNVSFIEIAGCVDMAIQDNQLYADSYTDLVTLDLSDMKHINEVSRVENAFPYTVPVPTKGNEIYPYAPVDPTKGLVVGWELIRDKREIEVRFRPDYPMYETDYANISNGGSSGIGGGAVGKSGSMARFGLYKEYLYIVEQYRTLQIYRIANAQKPLLIGTHRLERTVETMFIYDDHMFLGTTSGLLAYSLKVPNTPTPAGHFDHITSCDPVVVQDGYAYVTLRGGNLCGSNVNRLDVLKLSADYMNIELMASYEMVGPYGVGIDKEILFVCDGEAGLKVFDAKDKTAIDKHPLAAFPAIQAYDVIPTEGFLFAIGEDGFHLYDYSDINNIQLIGKIPVVH